MERQVTVTRSELVKIFATWNQQAAAGKWPARDDATASADHFLDVADKVKAGG